MNGAGVNSSENSAKRLCLGSAAGSAHYLSTTNIEKEAFSFLWKLNDYSTSSNFKKITSPIFHGGPKSNHSWQLLLYPKTNLEGVNYLGMYLHLVEFGDTWFRSFGTRKISVRFKFSVLDENGCASRPWNVPLVEFSKSSTTWGQYKYIRCSDLLSPTQPLVVDNCLKLLCEVWILDMKHSVQKCNPPTFPTEEERDKARKLKLASNGRKMFKDSILTDIVITVGETTFKAHKAILSANSPVFAAMFTADMIEKEQNSVVITDFEEDVVKSMLQYVYSGEIGEPNEQTPRLLEIAEKYNLDELKQDAEYAIAQTLNVFNAVEILMLAHTQNASFLKSCTMNFINCNKDEVMKTKIFQEAANDPATKDLFVELYHSKNSS
ncbi:Speckle-type POZ protein [Orchesella cincta]|uniref:Speckle-type POZ protein n=1 Tax=Orchesella cincta TaxID=48709 RepID=A0A1D2MC38_ORCCI|nr:Speckle-type POZ protein [Orchesella cincta]